MTKPFRMTFSPFWTTVGYSIVLGRARSATIVRSATWPISYSSSAKEATVVLRLTLKNAITATAKKAIDAVTTRGSCFFKAAEKALLGAAPTTSVFDWVILVRLNNFFYKRIARNVLACHPHDSDFRNARKKSQRLRKAALDFSRQVDLSQVAGYEDL